MIKKIILLFIIGFLTACGSKNAIDGENVTLVSGSGFEMKVPTNWSSSSVTDSLPAPSHGNIVLWAVSPEKKYNFSPNILIIREQLDYAGSSRQYSELNNKNTQKKYVEYKWVDSGILIFWDSDESKYYIFDAKYNSQTPKMRFIQTAKMCGTTVYLLHASVFMEAKTENYVNLFKTFACK